MASPPDGSSSLPGSTASLHAANRQRVWEAIRSAQGTAPSSQADLARATGLAPSTVSGIVRELADAEMVDTVVVGGRRGTLVTVAHRPGHLVGVDISHRHLRVAIGDMTGELLALDHRPVDAHNAYADELRLANQLLDGLLSGLGITRNAIALAVLGLPTPLSENGLVMGASILPGWTGVDAHREAEHYMGVPVVVENDANLGAIAEHRMGAGRDHQTMAFLRVAAGVGAGLILDGKLFRGAWGMAGELGHLTVDESGPFCRCGSRGCLEAYTSMTMAEAAMGTLLPGAGHIDELIAAARDGHVGARRAFEDAGLRLGSGLAALANLINPSCIVIGGAMYRAGDLLLDHVRVGLRRHTLASVSARTEVLLSQLGFRAPVTGALLLAADHVATFPAGTDS